jgi:predicted short-subunit dehydrogenase-like oxidoreductase (DUF2520 family)
MSHSDSAGCFKQELIGRNAAAALNACIEAVVMIVYVTDRSRNQTQFTRRLQEAEGGLPATKEPEPR